MRFQGASPNLNPMPRAVHIRTLFLGLLVLLVLIGFAGWIWSVLNARKVLAERDDSLAQRYLLECAHALESTRDNVTEKIAPLEGKSCEDPILTRTGLKNPDFVTLSEIRVNRALEPYSAGEYTVTVRSTTGRGWTLARGKRVVDADSP